MKIYLAAPYAARNKLRDYAAQLARIGYTITSTWLDETHDITPGVEKAATDLEDNQVNQHARQDLKDIDQSSLLVVFTAASVGCEGGGGRHVETGYALSRLGADNIIVVGEPENVFHRLRGVTAVPDWHQAVVELGHRLVAHERNKARPMDVAR